MKPLPLGEVYRYIEPGPVVLLTTQPPGGRPNVMTMSWHMMMEFEPPRIGCVVSAGDFSFAALRATRECVIAIPPVELASVVVKVGNCSGRECDKFAAFGLTPMKAATVAAPLIEQCFVNLECRVVDSRWATRYNLFVLEVAQAWIDPKRRRARTIHHHGYGTFVVDGETLRRRSRMR